MAALGDTLGIFTRPVGGDQSDFIMGTLYPEQRLFDLSVSDYPFIQIDLADIVYGPGRLTAPVILTSFTSMLPDSVKGDAQVVLHPDEGYANTLRFVQAPDGVSQSEGRTTAPLFAGDRLFFFTTGASPNAYPDQVGSIAVAEVDAQDNLIAQREIVLQSPTLELGGIRVLRGVSLQDRLYLLCTAQTDIGTERPLLICLDNDLQPIGVQLLDAFLDERGGKLYAHGDYLYVVGAVYNSPPGGGIGYDAQVIQLDAEMNVLWANQYKAERFGLSQVELAYSQANDELLLTYNTTGFFPAINATLSPADGSILSQRGYNLYRPRATFLASGALALLTPPAPAALDVPAQPAHFVLTDTDGITSNCEVLPSCLFRDPVAVSALSGLSVDTLPGTLILQHIETTVTPFSVEYDEGCFMATAPSPTFEVREEICLGDTLRPFGLANRTAHGVDWRLIGADTTLSYLNPTPTIVPPRVGTYTLEQTVWALGCGSSFSRTVEVIASYTATAPSPTYLCAPGDTLRLITTAPDTLVRWAHGPTGAAIPIAAAGSYTATLAAGTACAAEPILIDVRFLRDSIVAPYFDLPPDTTLCTAALPFSLVGYARYEAPLLVDDQPNPDLLLPGAGSYTLSYQIKTCTFSQPFELTADPCTPEYYLPTAFSPNGDGINDTWLPVGTTVEWLQLSVYDRWGGLLHQSVGPQSFWTGGMAANGVYVVRVEGVDVRTGEAVRDAVGVTLVR